MKYRLGCQYYFIDESVDVRLVTYLKPGAVSAYSLASLPGAPPPRAGAQSHLSCPFCAILRLFGERDVSDRASAVRRIGREWNERFCS
jgi:hypothetical protein